MPLAIVVVGTAAAFATNAAKQSSIKNAQVIGYYYDSSEDMGSRCKPVEVNCVNFGSEICTVPLNGQVWEHSTETLTGCTDLLYKIN
ncbi:hypothetical protein SAMN05421741_1302 [Paenimyroides ummariense]|uniref:Uncharacterized protein n=2 Tax=Paenimyroides ummariense TaxID=913024 RepID=A0A1I5FNF0_9FLAO|nr:hypothetical protein SAMN05421741_1302 [Paenimyroides ummariense]